MARELTERQAAYLDALFGEAGGDYNKAARLAGYATGAGAGINIAMTLEDEIIDRAKKFLALNAPKAALAMAGMIDSIEPNVVQRLKVCTEIMDRVGIVKKEKLEISGDLKGSIFWLPSKDKLEDPDAGST